MFGRRDVTAAVEAALADRHGDDLDIGDARQFVIVMYVYRYGELLWRGPGPYR